jgi:ribosomal protein S12 methylthiotransferase accessory factor
MRGRQCEPAAPCGCHRQSRLTGDKMISFDEVQNLARVHKALVNKRYGVITSLIEEPDNPDAPGLFVINSLTVEASYFRHNEFGTRQDSRNGSGAAFDRSTAMWASFGESLERYAAYLPDQTRLVFVAEEDLGGSAVPLEEFILFHDSQYACKDIPFHRPCSRLQRNWVAANDLTHGGERFVPAMMVYLGFKLSDPRENIMQNTSSGLSCGSTYLDAVRGGLYEVIERDAFASMWQLRYAPPRLSISDALASRLLPDVRRALASSHVALHLWSITSDTGIPVIMAAADAQRDGRVTFGACANADLVRAVNKAVIEALHGLVWSSRFRNLGKPMPERDQIARPSDHLAYYLEPGRREHLAFMFDSQDAIDSEELLPGVPRNVDEVTAHLGALGHRVLTVDVTTDDVAALGLHVVRTLVPSLQPLLFGGNLISLDERRLRTLARHWGIHDFPAPNPAPHPFP